MSPFIIPDDEDVSPKVKTRFIQSAREFVSEPTTSRHRLPDVETDDDGGMVMMTLPRLIAQFESEVSLDTQTNESLCEYVYYMVDALGNDSGVIPTPDAMRTSQTTHEYYDTVVAVCRTLHKALHGIKGKDKLGVVAEYESRHEPKMSLDAAFDKLGFILMTNRFGGNRSESDEGTRIPDFTYWVVQAMYDVAMLTPGFGELETMREVFVQRLKGPIQDNSDAWWMETLGFYRATPMNNGVNTFGPPGAPGDVIGDVADRLCGPALERIIETEMEIRAKHEIWVLETGEEPSVVLEGMLEKRKREKQITASGLLDAAKSDDWKYNNLVANLIEYIDPFTGERREDGEEVYNTSELYAYVYASTRDDERETRTIHAKYTALATELLVFANHWGMAPPGVVRLLSVVSPPRSSFGFFGWTPFSAKDPYPNLRK